LFSSLIHRHPTPTLFPYTTLFRSIPHSVRAVSATFGSAKKPSTWVEPSLKRDVRQHSRLENTRSAARTVSLTRRNGTCASVTFIDRKSTRLNSSHVSISYAVFCLK